MAKVESFEITEYGVEHEIPGRVQGVIKEIVRDMVRETPAVGMQVSFTGNLVKFTFHCYEMHLPVRLKQIEDTAKQALDQIAKFVKKEYKSRTGDSINLSEKKDMANTSAQKVSLNERYMYSSWRFYELG